MGVPKRMAALTFPFAFPNLLAIEIASRAIMAIAGHRLKWNFCVAIRANLCRRNIALINPAI